MKVTSNLMGKVFDVLDELARCNPLALLKIGDIEPFLKCYQCILEIAQTEAAA